MIFDSIDEMVHKLVHEAFSSGMIDPKDGAINLQIQVQVQFLAGELLDTEIDQQTYDAICARVEKMYPTTAFRRKSKKKDC